MTKCHLKLNTATRMNEQGTHLEVQVDVCASHG